MVETLADKPVIGDKPLIGGDLEEADMVELSANRAVVTVPVKLAARNIRAKSFPSCGLIPKQRPLRRETSHPVGDAVEKHNAHFFGREKGGRAQKQHGGAHDNKASLSCLGQNRAKPVDGVLCVGLQPAGQNEQGDLACLLEGKDRHPASRVVEMEVSSCLKKVSEENKKKAVL